MEGINPTHLKKQAKLEQEQDTQGISFGCP